jgi:hypothetical protein
VLSESDLLSEASLNFVKGTSEVEGEILETLWGPAISIPYHLPYVCIRAHYSATTSALMAPTCIKVSNQ